MLFYTRVLSNIPLVIIMKPKIGKIVTYYITEASKGESGFLASAWGILMAYAKDSNLSIYEELKSKYSEVLTVIEEYVQAEKTFFKSTARYVEEYPEAKANYLRYVGLAAYYAQMLNLIEDISDLLKEIEKLERESSEDEDEEDYEREGYFEIEFR